MSSQGLGIVLPGLTPPARGEIITDLTEQKIWSAEKYSKKNPMKILRVLFSQVSLSRRFVTFY